MSDTPERDEKLESSNERFERLTDQFYRETGIMAPWKDSPAALGVTDERGRWAAWDRWLAKQPRPTPPDEKLDGLLEEWAHRIADETRTDMRLGQIEWGARHERQQQRALVAEQTAKAAEARAAIHAYVAERERNEFTRGFRDGYGDELREELQVVADWVAEKHRALASPQEEGA